MVKKSPGHIEQLPSGSWRVKVYGGTDPLTGREIRLRKTCKTERVALIELGKLLEQAAAGRQPETNATVAELMDRYAKVADWDLSTRKANEAYIRRVIKPALGHLQVRKIRGPLLDLLYAQLRRCGDPGCTGKRFVEHRNVPTLSVVTPSRRPARQQVADTLRDAVNSGMLAAGESLPSVQEMSTLQDVRVATLQHALAVLAEEGLVVLRQGRTAVVAGDVVVDRRASPWNPDWATHKASDLAAAAGVKLNIKGLRHYTASQLLAARFDLRNTAARLGHGSGGATTLRHYADPVSEVDRRAAAYLAQLTSGSTLENS